MLCAQALISDLRKLLLVTLSQELVLWRDYLHSVEGGLPPNSSTYSYARLGVTFHSMGT